MIWKLLPCIWYAVFMYIWSASSPLTLILHIAWHTHAKVNLFVTIPQVFIFIWRTILYALSWDRVDFICWLRSVLTQTQYAHPSLLSWWGLSIDRYVFDIKAIKYSIPQPPQKTFCDFTFSLRHWIWLLNIHYWICLFICFPSVDCWLFSTPLHTHTDTHTHTHTE